jgi:hypothetical protein
VYRMRVLCEAAAGVAGGDHTAMVMITHEGIDRREVRDVLRRRWPDATVKELEDEEPTVALSASDNHP